VRTFIAAHAASTITQSRQVASRFMQFLRNRAWQIAQIPRIRRNRGQGAVVLDVARSICRDLAENLRISCAESGTSFPRRFDSALGRQTKFPRTARRVGGNSPEARSYLLRSKPGRPALWPFGRMASREPASGQDSRARRQQPADLR